MINKARSKNKYSKKDGFITIIVAVMACALVLVASATFSSVLSGQFQGVNGENGNGGSGATGEMSDCSGAATVPSKYMAWVKTAASRWMGGDEAGLISFIQLESSWDTTARSKSSTATGLGQFIDGTAEFMPEFYGGCDQGNLTTAASCEAKGGKFWPSAGITKGNDNPNDPRHNAERSIFAAARYFADRGAGYGTFLDKYKFGYHTVGKNGEHAAAAQEATDKLAAIYEKVKKGCTVSDEKVFDASESGCGNVPVFHQCDDKFKMSILNNSRTMCSAGCMLTSTAMVLRSYGASVDPKTVGNFANLAGNSSSGGVNYNFWSGIAHKYDLRYSRGGWDSMGLKYLQQGIPIIIYGTGSSAPFHTSNTHFMVVTCFDSKNRTAKINDPMGRLKVDQIVPESLIKDHLTDVRVFYK